MIGSGNGLSPVLPRSNTRSSIDFLSIEILETNFGEIRIKLQTVFYKNASSRVFSDVEGMPPKGPYPPCLRMAGRAVLAGYPRCETP